MVKNVGVAVRIASSARHLELRLSGPVRVGSATSGSIENVGVAVEVSFVVVTQA